MGLEGRAATLFKNFLHSFQALGTLWSSAHHHFTLISGVGIFLFGWGVAQIPSEFEPMWVFGLVQRVNC